MGLLLIPSEVTQRADLLKKSLENIMESYSSALSAIQNFSESADMDTQTWEKLQAKAVDYHQAIVQGMISAQDCIVTDAETLKQSVGSEELDEDLLIEQINKLKEEKQRLLEQISELESSKNKLFVGLFDSACDMIDNEIQLLQAEIEKIQTVIEYCQKKLDTLREIEFSTKGMFEGAIQILFAMGAAINDAGVEITGVGEMSGLDWKITLADANAEMDEKIRAFIEETLAAELQIDLNEVEELYGDSVVERLIKIMNENGISRFDIDGSGKFIEAAMTTITGYTVLMVGGKYQYKDKEGNVKELTSETAKEMLFIQAKMEELVNVASREVGTAEIGNTNEVKYNNWYYGRVVKDSWCAVFAMWCMDQTGLLNGECLPIYEDIRGNYFEGVINVGNWYKKNGRFYDAASGYEPKEGDLFFHYKHDGSGQGHTGIVVAYDKENNKIYTIEGNSGDKVALNERDYNSYFDGFGSNGGNSFGTIPDGYGQASTKDR